MQEQHLMNIIKSDHENKLAHAFLIETNDILKSYQFLKRVIKNILCENDFEDSCFKCNICHLIDDDVLPSVITISPDGQTIKKDQILDLKQKFITKPIYSKYNIYIILHAEKMNASSANTILKFLEEPEDGIIGFFITNNKENIIETIKSRCQIVLDHYEITTQNDENLQDIAIQYLTELHTAKRDTILYNQTFLQKNNLTKDDFQQVFQIIFDFYYECYQVSLGYKELSKDFESLSFLLKNNSQFFFAHMKLVEAFEEELGYNVNTNLLLDRFVIEEGNL